LEYTSHGLYFVNRNGNTLLEFKQTTAGQCISGVVINFLGKLLIKPVVVIVGRLLKQTDGFGIEHMRLTPSLPLLNATGFLSDIFCFVGCMMSHQYFLRQFVKGDPADTTDGALETSLDHLWPQT